MKRTLIALCIALLLLAGAGGGIYAAGHAPPDQENRLIGFGHLGTSPIFPGDQFNTHFFFTNPDYDNEVTITRICVTSGDGDVVYSGPYILYNPDTGERTVPDQTLNPYEIRIIHLMAYMYTGAGADPADYTDPDNWLSMADSLAQNRQEFMVEIFYESQQASACSLTGWWHTWYRAPGEQMLPVFEGQMVNVTPGK